MADKPPIRTPPAGQTVESPPRRAAPPADPCAMVIFGASDRLRRGDETLPAGRLHPGGSLYIFADAAAAEETP